MSPLATRLWQGYDLIQQGDYHAARELLEQLDCDDARQQRYFAQRDLLILKRNTAKKRLQKTAYTATLLILKSSVLPAVLFSKKWRAKYF